MFGMRLGATPAKTMDGLELTAERRLPPEEEARAYARWRRCEPVPVVEKRVGAVALGNVLKGIQESVIKLKEEHPKPAPLSSGLPTGCDCCQGAKFIRRDLPPNDAQFGQAIPCPKCTNPWLTYRSLVESIFPVPVKVQKLAHLALDELPTHLETTELADLVEDIVTDWPKGVLVALDGGYGTAKTHAAAIIYRLAWEKKIGAAYIESAQKLQSIFTNFDKQQRQVEVMVQAAVKRFDPVSGEELVKEEKRITMSRKQISAHLVLVPYLIIDEAHRYTRRGGNGWVEMKMADLINARLLRGKTTILIGNGMGDQNIIGRSGPHPLHPSILDRCREASCEWLDLNNVPSGRHRYERAGKWGANRQRKRRYN